ncbi:MAG: response regulator, partial [Planctomycetota bacterium]|nr:response regulator [Planctomycetota bacterium]
MSRWILVAEDETALGEMLRDNLAMESYNVELVQTGPAAIARMQQGGIDLLILDVMLPGCTGFEVLREMRGKGDKTPVLVLSA